MDVHEAVQGAVEALQNQERALAEQGEKLTLEGYKRRAALEAEYQTRVKTLENREKRRCRLKKILIQIVLVLWLAFCFLACIWNLWRGK